MTKFLYKIILPRADKIVCRDNKSYKIAKYYNESSVYYKDFAIDIINSVLKESKEEWDNNYLIINWNPYVKSKSDWKNLFSYANSEIYDKVYFIPGDISQDLPIYQIIKSQANNLEIYDRTKYTIEEIVDFFSKSQWWLWARLHFLLILHLASKKYYPIVYQDKVQKVLNNN